VPVSLLLVEGKLDAEVLSPVLWSLPTAITIETGGSKGSLKPKCHDKRTALQSVEASYIRDRDFDFEPPTDTSRPTMDSKLGWRWSRHELENYLLEPAVLAGTVGCPTSDAEAALLTASAQIRHYTAARWSVGIARRSLPPFKELATRPPLGEGIKIPEPSALSLDATRRWVLEHIGTFREKIGPVLSDTTIIENFLSRVDVLAQCSGMADVLVWHSGKDLLAALEPAFYRSAADNPKVLQRRLAAWVREHPERMLELVPEWRALLALLRGPGGE